MGGRDRENQPAAQRAGVAAAQGAEVPGRATLLRLVRDLQQSFPPGRRTAAWLDRLQHERFLGRILSEHPRFARRQLRRIGPRAAPRRTERTPDPALPGGAPRQFVRALRRRESGRRLDPHLRQRLAPVVGFDPASVRIYIGPTAAAAARLLQARAFTIGRDVFFGAGRFAPHTSEGEALIAHELTHVRQQTRGVRLQRDAGTASADPLEREAQQTASRVRDLARARPIPPPAPNSTETPAPANSATPSPAEHLTDDAALPPTGAPAASEQDPAVVAERIYRLMVKEARTARARGMLG